MLDVDEAYGSDFSQDDESIPTPAPTKKQKVAELLGLVFKAEAWLVCAKAKLLAVLGSFSFFAAL